MLEKVNCWQYSRDRKTIKTWELPLARSSVCVQWSWVSDGCVDIGWMFFMFTGLITIYLLNMTNNNRLEDEIVDSVRENTKRLKHGNFLRQMTWSFCVQWFESRGILFILFFYCLLFSWLYIEYISLMAIGWKTKWKFGDKYSNSNNEWGLHFTTHALF